MKRKLLLTFAILPAFSFLGISQTATKSAIRPVTLEINKTFNRSVLDYHNQPKANQCIDTLHYPLVKQQLLGPDGLNGFNLFDLWQSDNEAISMMFHGYTGMQVHGVEFLGMLSEESTVPSATVRASIYNADASNNPTGTALASASVTITSLTQDFYSVQFGTPVTVNGNFVITLDVTNTDGIYSSFINSATANQVIDENLSRFKSDYAGYGTGGQFVPITSVNFGGTYDFEPVLAPIVSYQVNTTGTVTPTSACLGTPVTLTNTSTSGQLSDRMYSFQKFRHHFGLATNDSTFVWDVDTDANPATSPAADLIWSANSPFTYPNVGTFGPTIISIGGFWSNCYDGQQLSVTINPVDDAAFAYGSSTVCEGSSNLVPSSIATPGGTFTASPAGLVINASTGEVDVANSATNTYTITYTTAGTCSSSSTQNLTITSAPDASFEYAQADYCSTETTITPNITGSAGVFSATSGLSINSGTGVIDVAASLPGTYVVTNDIAASGTCPSASESFTITITEAPNSAFSYAGSSYCLNASNPTATVTGTAGTFASTSGLSVNATTGEIDLANSSAGTYDVSNTVAGSGACAASVTTVTIAITEASTANFSYAAAEFCATGSENATVTGTSGVFTASPSGLSIDGSTGAINLASSTAGTYTVTNTVDATATCGAATYSETITINELPSAAVTSTETTITATEAGATYQWVSCSTNTNISGATSQTYTPVVSGSYKVIVTKDGCSATSECVTINVVGIEENNMDYVTVSPNPASDLITVAGLTDGSVTISVLDVNGKLMAKEVTTTGQAEISVSKFESGVYFIAITSDSINGVKKFVKK